MPTTLRTIAVRVEWPLALVFERGRYPSVFNRPNTL